MGGGQGGVGEEVEKDGELETRGIMHDAEGI